ncbi:mitogen-activated protein kinase 15 isoform 3-T6 [Acridotheres tristis]
MSPPEVEPLVCRRYEIKRRLGKGAYGIVWKAIDRKTGETVAVKKIFDAFRNRTDAQRTFREIMFLQEFGEHPNIIKLLDVIQAENDKDIYLIFESMETDLHAVIKKGNLLKDIHKCYILYQLLKATKFIHSGNVIHRDQKPSNVLLDGQCCVKLCDFGLARSLCQLGEEQPSPALTEYVATRWYRAPEILLASRSYTKGVDMWSIGCILGEMLLGKPLFPGTSTMNQIEQILRVIPAPSPEDILALQSEYKASVINHMSSRFHCPSREPSLDFDVILPLGDDVQLSVAEYRNKLYEMILEKKSKSLPKEQRQRENIQLSQSESSTLLPGFSSVTVPTRKGQQEPTAPLLNPSHVHTGATAGAQPAGSSQSKDLARTVCQRSQISVMVYNPITHTTVQRNANPGAGIRNCSAPPQQSRISNCEKVGRQITWPDTQLSPTSVQNLYNNPRNSPCHSKDVRLLPKPSKKMFQITANVEAAGDPRASMGSYSQAYGTINKSALQSLPIAKASKTPEQ